MSDPRIISLDIETYGMVKTYPEQTVFHPKRMAYTDGVPIERQILTCAITVPKLDTRLLSRWPSQSSCSPTLASGWHGSAIAALEPGPTMVFRMWNPSDRRILAAWLRWADTIMGMNLPFDIQCLRQHPDFRFLLDGSQILLDLSYINYLDSEARPERSLKTIGPVIGTHIYGKPRGTRYESITDPELLSYNGQDTHNTLLGCAELAKRIGDHPWKLSGWCIQFYSDTFWSCIRMAEAGVPMDVDYLTRLKGHLLWHVDRLYKECDEAGVRLSGEGSQKSKDEFLTKVIEACPADTINHPLLVLTDKTKKVSFADENRNLLSTLLPKDHPYQAILKKIGNHTYFQKLLSSYIWPLLHHSRRDETDRRSVILPPPAGSTVGLMYPTWYPVPAPQKDGAGADGGTIQGRITCKFHQAQTFPPIIKRAERSRYGDEGCIVSMDLSQVELRVGGLLSGDQSLVTSYQQNLDLHGDRAEQVYGKDLLIRLYGVAFRKNKLFKDAERQDGKQLNFADLFLASPGRMQRTILELRGKLYAMSFFENIERSRYLVRTGLTEWQYELACTAEREGVITLPFTGQSRFFTGFELDHELWKREKRLKQKRRGGESKNLLSEIVNFPVQTTAGNTLLRIKKRMPLPHINHVDPPYRLYINVYDALRFDCKKKYVPELLGAITEGCRLVEQDDYWGMIQSKLGRTVPLKFESKVEE